MRVLVCGGRNYDDEDRVFQVLGELGPSLVIQGGALGADRLALKFAEMEGIPCIEMRAMWGALGNGAGPIRNGWMLKYGQPDLVLAFPGGRGTANMMRQAREAGVQVRSLGREGEGGGA